MLSFLLATAISLAPAHQRTSVQMVRTFDVYANPCTLKVEEAVAPEALNEKATVSCEGSVVWSENFGLADVRNVTVCGGNYTTRVFFEIERGLMSALVVIRLSGNQFGTKATKVFEHYSQEGAEFFERGDVVLAHVGRRFTDSGILPERTNVYRWNGDSYVFERAFRWKSTATWNDRYCILWEQEHCSAEQTRTRIPDEYEKLRK